MVLTKFEFNMDFRPIERSLVSPLIKNFKQLEEKTIEESGDLLLKLVKFYAPRDTGKYAKSWRIKEKTKTSVTIASTENTLFVVLEFGVDHEVRIDAKEGGVLHWKDASGLDHFAKFVIIPPRKAQPHVRRALRDIKRIWKDVALANLGDLVPAFNKSTRKNRQNIQQLQSKLTRPN